MPSVVPSYEYDIFISYRQKDNRSGHWVTGFVKALQEELDSTFKESISIYFDENPADGLLETHNVDKSLEGKIKCLVFIPIVSRTYCDPNSFAWQQEFCAFNKMALGEKIGRDIKLGSGNVASRILPVTIHDLDPDDLKLIEDEMQSKFRGIEFIYRSPGVNRPLRPDDRREDNLNKLVYRDQINKVANALKEIIYAIYHPQKSVYSYVDEDSQYLKTAAAAAATSPAPAPTVDVKSIAVLPFVSLAQDSSQEYFADGITENILIQLASQKQLRVISRTSVMRYKKTTKTAPEIAKELAVKYILEGSAQSHANKVKINVQLVDGEKDDPIWSKVFVESMDDIFTVQDKVAETVSEALQDSIGPRETNAPKEAPTKNMEAYDLFLKGRHAFNQWNVEGYRAASDYFKQALEKDPEFKMAYSYMASSYSARMSWNGDLSPAEALPYINQYLDEAWKRGATDNDYLTKAFVEFFVNKDFAAAERHLLKAHELSPSNATVLFTYSYVLCMMGRFQEAEEIIQEAKLIEPLSVAYFNYQSINLYLMGQHAAAVSVVKEGMKLFRQVVRFADHLGRIYLTTGHYKEARETLVNGFRHSIVRPPSMIAYLAVAQWHLDEKEKSDELLKELLQLSERGEKGVNYYLSHVYASRGDLYTAAAWITKARLTNDIDLIWFDVDPLLEEVRDFLKAAPAHEDTADFKEAEAFITDKLLKELPDTLSYHNMDHIRDVLDSAMAIAAAENIDAKDIQLLRLAALYHDAGFIKTYKDHEERGCEMAKETLPHFGVSEAQLAILCGMIMATKIPQSPKTNLERILCDADLDYLGREDFYEIGSRLYAEMKARGYVETEREWNLTQKVFLENHKYHTRYSIEHREPRKKQYLAEVVSKLQR